MKNGFYKICRKRHVRNGFKPFPAIICLLALLAAAPGPALAAEGDLVHNINFILTNEMY